MAFLRKVQAQNCRFILRRWSFGWAGAASLLIHLVPWHCPDTQVKTPFVVDYPINASPKILFPYLATAGGLAQWFCDDVNATWRVPA